MLQYSAVANHSDILQQSLGVAFKTAKAPRTSRTVALCCEAEG